MELSPNDIRNFEFPTQLRGYDKEAVDNFKEQMAIALEVAKQERAKLTMEIESVRVQLAGLKQFEDAIKNAAIDARCNADMTIANAKKEAEQMLSSVKNEASQLMATRSQKRDELETQITKLELTKKSYLTKLRGLISSHLQWVEEFTHAEYSENPAADNIEVTESSEVSRRTRETIANEPHAAHSIHTEEANAAQQIIAAASSPIKEEMPMTDVPTDTQPEPQAVDPELAAALDNYRKLAESRAKSPAVPSRPTPRTAPPAVKFTNRPSPDFPDGFVTPNVEGELSHSTDRMKVQDQSVEHNKVNLDAQISETPAEPNPADDLADVLDNVVHKFEETMDKAAKS